jgi:hypothetical protein
MIYSKTLYFNKVFCYKLKRYKAKHFKGMRMARNDKQMNVRMAHESVEGLKEAAKTNRRSVTAQLNLIVEEWLKSQKESAKA